MQKWKAILTVVLQGIKLFAEKADLFLYPDISLAQPVHHFNGMQNG